MTDIAANIAVIRQRIGEAEVRVGRDGEVQLVAVSKTVPMERIREAFEAGQRIFGENRVQEAIPKVALLPDAAWHLIGHLQTNKAKAAVGAFALVESLDSMRLASRLNDEAGKRGTRLPVLLEVNVAGEPSKAGFTCEGCYDAIPELSAMESLDLRGLMTVAPLTDDPESIRWVFSRLRELRDRIRQDLTHVVELSMGMSGDYEVAIEEGATMVRLGRAIFGDRPLPILERL